MHDKLIRALVKKHGAKHRKDISRGLSACERVWDFKRAPRADFEAFCEQQYVPPGKERETLLGRLDEFHHGVAGSLGMAVKTVRAGQDIADRPTLAAERVLGAFAPGSHLSEDYRHSRIAALAQLNFGHAPAASRNGASSRAAQPAHDAPRTRAGWAARRIGDLGREVVPAELVSRFTAVQSEVDRFISGYNLHLDRFDFGDARIKFPKGTRLVSHWGLRDYMMSLNGARNALVKQRAILDLMERVVDGEIPEAVLDNPAVGWDIAAARLRVNGKSEPAKGHGPLRWAKFRDVWKVHREVDPYRRYGNLIDEKFLVDRELPEAKVVSILTDVLSSPLAERVGRYISDQLGRELEPFDVYYRNFLADDAGKEPLSYDIRKQYPNAAALNEAIADVLVKLGWKRDRARWIRSRIRVDNGRSAGHAWPPAHDADLQLLRVRVDGKGCDEMSFETYMHELGHCVEGVLSSYEMDYKALWGVPNTAFTEGFAFTFQDRTDEILGRRKRAGSPALPLLRFWEPFEIAGSALTEIRLYHWLYDNPNASARQIMHAVRRIGDEVWGEFYARIFGPSSHGLMSIYSHMLWGDFYLAEYPMGYVIAYQVRKHLAKRPLAREMERMCGLGSIYPEEWMQQAVGQEISVQPLLDDTRKALDRLGY